MSLRMDPMTEDELAAFLVRSRTEYIDQRVEFGGEPRASAEETAARQYAEMFPEGRPAPGHSLFLGRDADGGGASVAQVVGHLWLYLRSGGAGNSAFVYSVEVEQGRRGQGWGRALMRYAESWAVERGATQVELNVFGGNAVARRLYESMGYLESAVHMRKPVG